MSQLARRLVAGFEDVIARPVLELLQDASTVRQCNNQTTADLTEKSRASQILYLGITAALVAVLLYAATALALRLFRLVFQPINRVKRLGSIGYLNHESGKISKRELANMIRKRRKCGKDLPPVYPNGWFRVIDTVELKRKEVKQVYALGQNFAVFRGSSGKVTVMDAYCAHMGGNLAAGGIVKGDCLECPFHGWIYDREGKCVDIPYADKVPTFAKVKVWTSREVNGVVFIWYHCDGIEPQWQIPVVPEIASGKFLYRGRVEHHINAHIQDIPENGSDLAHLSHLHVPSVFCGVNLAEQFKSWFNFADHIFKVYCKGASEDEPHISKFDMSHYVHLFRKWKVFHLNLHVDQIGPGIVHLHMQFPWFKAVLVQSLTPVGPLHQVLIHSLHAEWTCPIWIGKIILEMEAMQVDRDVMVWNNKTFSAKPLLVKEDAQITKYRRWFAQFYSENSPRFKFSDEDDIDW